MNGNPNLYDDLYEHICAYHEKFLPEDDVEFYEFLVFLKKVVFLHYQYASANTTRR